MLTSKSYGSSGLLQGPEFAASVMDTVRESLLILDSSLRIITANRAFYRTFHHTPEDTEGQHLYDLGNRQWNIPRLRALLESENDAVEGFAVELDIPMLGWRTLSMKARWIDATQEKTRLLVVEDITENTRAVVANRISETRFEDVAEFAADWIWEMDAHLRFCYLSGRYEQITGHAMDQLLGKTRREQYRGLVESERAGWQAHLATLDAHESYRDFTYSYRRPDGEWLVLVNSGKALLDGEGRFLGYRGVGRDITKHERTEQRLRESEQQFRDLAEGSIQGIVIHRDGKALFANQAYAEAFGYDTPQDILSMDNLVLGVAAPHEHDRLLGIAQAWARGETAPAHYECQGLCKDGSLVWISNIVRTVRWQGQPAIQSTVFDITARKQAEKALFEEKERTEITAEVTLKAIGDAVITTDADGAIQYLNPVAETLTGWTQNEAQGQPLGEVFHVIDEHSGKSLPSPVTRCLAQGSVVGLGSHALLVNRQGQEYAIQDSAAPIRNRNNDMLGVVVTFSDVTAARRLSQQLSHQATHDALTGLVNRAEFEHRLKRVLETAHTVGGEYALCYLDLDQFKVINDTCGHVAGDELLRQVSAVLQEQVRERDTLARLGGDEFGVLMEHCPLAQALRVAHALRDALDEFRFAWEGNLFRVGVSIGLVPITETSDIASVLSSADVACYAAKDKGRNRVHVYRAGDAELATRRGQMRWVAGIERALEETRFRLVHQPIAPLRGTESGSAHYELLLRMEDDAGQLIEPQAFLPAAERYDLATRIDRWVVHNAFTWFAEHRQHLERLHLCEINLSGQSLGDDALLKMVMRELEQLHIPPKKICFEVTETAAITNLASATHFIETLKGVGCQFALDDFGSGLSSFAYLKNLPADFLKIDGAFVKDVVDDPIDLAMVKSINDIAHAMGKRTIAECVETKDILETLRRSTLGVDYVQGFYIGHPRPMEDIA